MNRRMLDNETTQPSAASFEEADFPSGAPRRRVGLPVTLFFATCLSTFWVGASHWSPANMLLQSQLDPSQEFFLGIEFRRTLYAGWESGLIYAAALLSILLFHEMGHFLTAVRYRVPASLPFFLPLPITLIGTLGAVIGLDGRRADRKEIFDIGLAGPLAGLVVAVPVMWLGVTHLDLTSEGYGGLKFDLPLLARWMLNLAQPDSYQAGQQIWLSQLNPWFMAGWVGLVITGLNMLPVSQLDGGHVVYTVFGRAGRWIARGVLLGAIAYIVVFDMWMWTPMVFIIMLIGVDHPPTRDDTVPLGFFRTALGVVSLAIPWLCFPPMGLTIIDR